MPRNLNAVAADDGTLSSRIALHLPYLRRFARALSGSQKAGDAYVGATLEAVIADRTALGEDLPLRNALYRLFLRVWSSAQVAPTPGAPDTAPSVTSLSGANLSGNPHGIGSERLARLTPASRQALLLTTLEEFAGYEAAGIMGVAETTVADLVLAARTDLAGQLRSRVMIIEDEPVIAVDIESIVLDLGHTVTGIADTHRSAVELALRDRPDLVLADIQLADGSSGVEAVEEILRRMSVPVIFITAYPERLLTGQRPEPTFLVTKPFRTETVEAAISQVLFLNGP